MLASAILGRMKQSRIKKLADIFGALGYLSTALLWLWAALLLVPWLSSLGLVKKMVIVRLAPAHHALEQHAYAPPEWLLYIIVAAAFLVVLVAIVYVVKLPAKTARTVSQATHTAAHKLAVEIVHTPQPPTKQQLALGEAIVWSIKAALVVVPVVVVIVAALLTALPFALSVVMAVTIYLVSWPILWFLLQYSMATIDSKRRPNSPVF